jgi:hypothetical protein
VSEAPASDPGLLIFRADEGEEDREPSAHEEPSEPGMTPATSLPPDDPDAHYEEPPPFEDDPMAGYDWPPPDEGDSGDGSDR